MGRYIDTDLFIEDLIDYNIGRSSLDEMIKCLRNQPTADVTPIVHGEWIDFDIDYGGIPAVAYQCSECGKSNGFITDFCPNCGAKMDGKITE